MVSSVSDSDMTTINDSVEWCQLTRLAEMTFYILCMTVQLSGWEVAVEAQMMKRIVELYPLTKLADDDGLLQIYSADDNAVT